MAKLSPRVNFGQSIWHNLFAGLTGFFFTIGLLKFGNPAIFENLTTSPTDIYEWIFQPWPVAWGYAFIALLIGTGLMIGRFDFHFDRKQIFALGLPLFWLGWQFISATRTVDPNLTRMTLKHFVACVICFYLGWFCLSRIKDFSLLFITVLAGFLVVILTGWQQHFGGLEETRHFFYAQPNWRDYPPDFLKKVASTRIYSTLFYPNTLAAAILLFLPISVAGGWLLSARFNFRRRIFFALLVCGGACACLIWSGSKSGWLLMLLMAFVAVLQLSFDPRLKRFLVLVMLILGLGGFALKYAGFFQRGATSVAARFDYWRAALETARQHPLLGTGPGTFGVSYQKIKRADAEMARLAHNDYLQQASDAGVLGFVAFLVLVFGSLIVYRPLFDSQNPARFCIWLGLVGLSLHSLVEFNFYIPALAWPAFFLFGWLGGSTETNRQKLPVSVGSSR